MPCFRRISGTGRERGFWRWDDVVFSDGLGLYFFPLDRQRMGTAGKMDRPDGKNYRQEGSAGRGYKGHREMADADTEGGGKMGKPV